MPSKKRDMLELIEIFYDHLSSEDEVFLSSFRDLDEDKRIYYPTNKRILEIISAIQDKPYVYIKHPSAHKDKQKQNTILKLSTQQRDPKTRYIQINDVIRKTEDRYDHLKKMVENATSKDYKIWIDQYQDFVQDIISQMKRLRDRDKEYVS